MSQENVEIVRQAVQASIAKPPDFETVDALYHADHVLRSDGGVEGRTYRGASGFAEAIDDLDATWQEWRQEIDDILDAGDDDVVVLVRLVATGRQSGALVEQPWAMGHYGDRWEAHRFAHFPRPPPCPQSRGTGGVGDVTRGR